MKTKYSLLCLCMAILLLLSSVFSAILPFEHDCSMHEGCTVCLLMSAMKHLLHALWLIALALSAFDRLLLHKRVWASGRPSVDRFHSTLIELHVKLSN